MKLLNFLRKPRVLLTGTLFNFNKSLNRSDIEINYGTGAKIYGNINHISINDFIENNKSSIDVEQISDGYHTFQELYEFRTMYNASLFNLANKTARWDVHKSIRHFDGDLCFGGEYFIVVAMLPGGQISNHYPMKDWNLFQIPAYDKAKYPYDGHSSQDVINRLKDIL